jgi:hypothetical protein
MHKVEVIYRDRMTEKYYRIAAEREQVNYAAFKELLSASNASVYITLPKRGKE